MYHLAPTLLTNNYTETVNQAVKYINSGGCGVFAERLYDVLIKCKNKPKLFIIGEDEEGLLSRIKGESEMNGTLVHIVVGVGKYFYDSDGKHKNWIDVGGYRLCYKKLELVEMDIETLRKWNKEAWRWNSLFDRHKIKTIDKLLTEAYSNVKKNLVVLK